MLPKTFEERFAFILRARKLKVDPHGRLVIGTGFQVVEATRWAQSLSQLLLQETIFVQLLEVEAGTKTQYLLF